MRIITIAAVLATANTVDLQWDHKCSMDFHWNIGTDYTDINYMNAQEYIVPCFEIIQCFADSIESGEDLTGIPGYEGESMTYYWNYCKPVWGNILARI